MVSRGKAYIKIFASILVVIILASCNSGNKVVSSVGKRKYTKGFYSFLHPAKLKSPAIVNQIPSGKPKNSPHESTVVCNINEVLPVSSSKPEAHKAIQNRTLNKQLPLKTSSLNNSGKEGSSPTENIIKTAESPYYPHYHSDSLDRAMNAIAIIYLIVVLLVLISLIFIIIGIFSKGKVLLWVGISIILGLTLALTIFFLSIG